ncbi:D-alanine--D-alanine ligase [Hydrogenimonas sp.]|uniref:D-alanine--D-alanine ligase n=1 Tax=Hydrogenimonas sp. TaxID=2231112 RepID=UPI002639CB28|nr:D-alanine--D-alanine ligase [Hydrogenimonas sp.]
MKPAILFGGASYEHEISIVSAIALKKVLKTPLTFIFLDAEGGFWHIPAEKMRSNHFSSGDYRKDDPLTLVKGGFEKRGFLKAKPLEGFDTVLNLVHGGQGEDGTIASLMEFFAIPYIGPRKEASVISYNKWLTKLYAEGIGVQTVEYQVLHIDGDRNLDFDFPVIVKPLRLGSSIGVSIVRKREELDFALDVAFEFDDDVLVEPFIEGIEEFNIAGCKTDEGWILSRIEAPQKKEFLDFDQKYLDFARTEGVQEAKIDPTLQKDLEETFEKVYGTLFEGALIRCDFFFASGEILLNEINPIPGSMANYLFDDFAGTLSKLARSLPRPRSIRPDYAYINRVQSAKGPKTGMQD